MTADRFQLLRSHADLDAKHGSYRLPHRHVLALMQSISHLGIKLTLETDGSFQAVNSKDQWMCDFLNEMRRENAAYDNYYFERLAYYVLPTGLTADLPFDPPLPVTSREPAHRRSKRQQGKRPAWLRSAA
jgi:hypothetical protein